MVIAAGLLLLAGLGLFLAGVLTGEEALYWACVGTCAVAAVLLVLARRRLTSAAPAAEPATGTATTPGRHAVGDGAASHRPTTPPPPTSPAQSSPAARADVPEPAPETVQPGEPPVEEVEPADLLLVAAVRDDVLVVDEHPRYHVAGCRHLAGQAAVALPVDEARTDGFTACGDCRPDATLAGRVRARRAPGG